MNEYRAQRLKEDLTFAQQRNKRQRQQLANYKKVHEKDLKEIERLNNIINEALGIANERFNYYSNHKNNNQEHLEDWGNIFNILLRRDDK